MPWVFTASEVGLDSLTLRLAEDSKGGLRFPFDASRWHASDGIQNEWSLTFEFRMDSKVTSITFEDKCNICPNVRNLKHLKLLG